jgi:cysteine desulfurase
MVDNLIYLDYAATTPVDPEALAAMQPFFGDHFGNPSSIYGLGQESRSVLDQARTTMARVLRAKPAELVITSGATESDNLALTGVAWEARLQHPGGAPPHLIVSKIEHSAVLYAARWLEQQGFSVSYVACDQDGLVTPAAVEALIRPETCLVSIMYANNEIGTIQPIAEIAEDVHRHGARFHTDAVQAAGMLPLDVDALGVDLLTLSAHKFYGPKGIGLLYVRSDTRIAWTQRGGGQEAGRRGGTENVPAIVGMAVALAKADHQREDYRRNCRERRDQLVTGLQARLPDLTLNGPSLDGPRLPNNANLSFPGVQGETLLLALDMEGIAASAGSACTAGKSEPSHVLEAIGASEEQMRSSVRFTVGRDTTAEEIDESIDIITASVERIRQLARVA